ncbi:hypothetical protein FQN60_014374 [Etheostoma spectabile]|uniref:Uncharacterized protein n=1 Tax=Etheostoma spectabile TaxID=54343 RepID=A0A5J5DBS1_9PERO|nr:hypothetical protein FQN60_014374 [Etheostoma spectabile]
MTMILAVSFNCVMSVVTAVSQEFLEQSRLPESRCCLVLTRLVFWTVQQRWSMANMGKREESRQKKNEKDRQTLISCENTGLSLFCSPEEDAQDVGYEQHQADSGGEALAAAAPLDVLVLWHIGQGPPKHHEAGRHPGQQRPRALHVLLHNHL